MQLHCVKEGTLCKQSLGRGWRYKEGFQKPVTGFTLCQYFLIKDVEIMRLVGSNKISTSCMHNYCWFSLVGKKQKAEGDFLEWLCDRLARHPCSGDSIIVALFLAMWFTGKDPLPWCLSLAERVELWLKPATSRDRLLKYSYNLLSCEAPEALVTILFHINYFIIQSSSLSGSQFIKFRSVRFYL